MTSKQPTTLRAARNELAATLAKLHPTLKPDELKLVEVKLLTYLAKGLREGWKIALIKETGVSLDVRSLDLIERSLKQISQGE